MCSVAAGKEKALVDALPEAIVQGSAFGKDVTEVVDWGDLIDDDSPAARLTAWKARASFAMQQVLAAVPPLSPLDIKVVHRSNSVGAVRTEIWTAKEFAPGELIIAPWTHEIKDRLYTTGLSVSLGGLPKDAVPGNRVLALDGRKRNHLGHGDLVNNVPGAGGNLYWCIQRTSDKNKANLFLEYVTVRPAHLFATLPQWLGGYEGEAHSAAQGACPRQQEDRPWYHYVGGTGGPHRLQGQGRRPEGEHGGGAEDEEDEARLRCPWGCKRASGWCIRFLNDPRATHA